MHPSSLPPISSAPLISLDGKQQGHGSHRLLTTSSSFARVWRWKKSQVEHHHHVPGIQVYCAFWGKYCSVFRVSRKTIKRSSCSPLGIYRAAISTWVPPTRQQGHVAKALGGRHGRELTSICGSELDILKRLILLATCIYTPKKQK